MKSVMWRIGAAVILAMLGIPAGAGADVYLRVRVTDPGEAAFAVQLGGVIHKEPWGLPRARFPKEAGERFPGGGYSGWINLTEWAGEGMHGRMGRAGGVAEYPYVAVQVEMAEMPAEVGLEIELADGADAGAVKKRWVERAPGGATGFLVSPEPGKDAGELESASEMAERRLRWAKEASGGKRVTPEMGNHIIQTSLWGGQRGDLNLKEAETLWLLGFNVLGNQHEPIGEKFGFARPGHTHHVAFGPEATRDGVDALVKGLAEKAKGAVTERAPYGFSDEIAARPRIEGNAAALGHFHAWLKGRGVGAAELGVGRIEDVVPIETPDVLEERKKGNEAAARRVFYYTSRFRQEAGTERILWHTEAMRRELGGAVRTTALVADHPFFGGTGLGMGIRPDSCWGNHALALDWFDLARRKALDVIGIEDWLGLQYMYGPHSTWEGFQLMGFQAAMMRSGGRGEVPIIAWITPSDEVNLRLKSASALCQGAKHFFYWTYGPTNTSTENYWSDLRGAYDGIVHITRQLAACGDTVAEGKMPGTRVALLFSISSDLFQPFDYLHMLERRCLYLSLVHGQYGVDMLTEEDVVAGRLGDYDVLYTADPCLSVKAATGIREWVRGGGRLFGTCGAGSMNEFGERVAGLADVFGIGGEVGVELQEGNYRVRGELNAVPYLDEVAGFGVIGMRAGVTVAGGEVVEKFKDGRPAVVENRFGKGLARYVATTPGVSYAKDAKFVPAELKEKWPEAQRGFINAMAEEAGVGRAVRLSEPVVEAGLYVKGEESAALVLANFTYEEIGGLGVEVELPFVPREVRSCEKGKLGFEVEGKTVRTKVELGTNDILIFAR